MRISRSKALLAVGACVAVSLGMSTASADPIRWDRNGHYYELLTSPKTWPQAKLDAEARTYLGVQGHLLTVTSQLEQNFIINTFGEPLRESWIGGFLGAQGWEWLTGEPFFYTNWAPGEPTGDGPVVNFHGANALGTWNDIRGDLFLSYFVEYDIRIDVLTEAFSVVFGLLSGGGLNDLINSDNSYLEVTEAPAFAATLPSIRVEFQGTYTDSISELTFRIELSCSAAPPIVVQHLEMYNYDTSSWDLVLVGFATPADTVITHTPATPSDYIEAGTGEMKSRISLFDPGILFSPGWKLKIDQAVWTIVR